MRLPHFKKKFIAGALAAGMVMGAGGIAAAYFLATESFNTGTATVGTSHGFTVSNVGVTGLLYPSTTTNAVHATVRNPAGSHGNLGLIDLTVTITGTSTPTHCSVTNFTFVATGTARWAIVGTSGTNAYRTLSITPVVVKPGQYFTGANASATTNSGSNALGDLRIQMITKGAQTTCKTVNVDLTVTANTT